jgi:hypothetical protein
VELSVSVCDFSSFICKKIFHIEKLDALRGHQFWSSVDVPQYS